jgi:hypothetical protein
MIILTKTKEMNMSWHRPKTFTLILLVSLFMVGSSIFAGNGPQIHLPDDTWDFGRVEQGQSLDHVFTFKNTGNAPLLIEKVRTTCGCTAALVSDKKLEPGEKGELKVTLNTRGFEGRITKYVYLESNDKKNPRTQLKISADIDVPPRPKIELDKYSHDLGLLLEGEEIQVFTTIENKGERELHIRFSHEEADFFLKGKKAPALIKISSRKKANIEIRLPSSGRTGMIREYIMIRSNDPVRSSMSLYLSGYVVSEEQLKTLFDKYKDIINK